MSFAEELAKLANLGILDHDGSLLGFRGNHIVNRRARGGGNSNCRWAGILIVADHLRPSSGKSRPMRFYSMMRSLRSNRFRLKPQRSHRSRNLSSFRATVSKLGSSATSESVIP